MKFTLYYNFFNISYFLKLELQPFTEVFLPLKLSSVHHKSKLTRLLTAETECTSSWTTLELEYKEMKKFPDH